MCPMSVQMAPRCGYSRWDGWRRTRALCFVEATLLSTVRRCVGKEDGRAAAFRANVDYLVCGSQDKSFVNKRRQLPMYCVLVEHPIEGLILWETGSGKDYPTVWGPQLADIFTRVRYEAAHELDAAIEATGHKIEDVKKIIIGHLHLDHAGGLDMFLDRKDVEIWV